MAERRKPVRRPSDRQGWDRAAEEVGGRRAEVVFVEPNVVAVVPVEPVDEEGAVQPSPGPEARSEGLDVGFYQGLTFDEPRCWSLVARVYADTFSRNPAEVRSVNETMREAARTFRLRLFKDPNGVEQITEPRDYAIVLMWRTIERRRPHCGIYYSGSVLHASEGGTVLFQDMASLRDNYPVMEFWAAP
jgi:hypothetical protein